MENLILTAAVINRIVEIIKQAIPFDPNEHPKLERWRTVILLLLSFVLGDLAMIFIFPANNLFPGASSELAGLVFSGILVGGTANGFDWLGTIINKRAEPLNTQVQITAEAGDPSAANKIVQAVQEQAAA